MTVINAKSMASDPVKIRLHYGGKVVEDPVITYVGEIQWQLIEIDMDKLSLPEIVDCAAEVCSYKKGTFSIYWHLPDMPIENHLVELKDDKDVKDMVYVYGDNPFKVITDLYVNLIQGEAQYSDPIGRDSNDQMYPVAWAVVEGENNDSWGWFMNELYKCLDVTEGGKGWTLISDQQKGLLNGVAQYWGNAEHRNCARHIYANWHKKYKGDDLKSVFWKAVRAYSEADYKLAIEDMKKISTDAVTDFIKQNPKCFCRCYLVTDSKADVVVNNMAETFNGFIIQSRSKHIINMLEDIRVAIMTRLVNKEREMVNKNFIVCPRVQKKLDKEKAKAYKCNISPSTKVLFQVKELDEVCVDIEKKTCTCRKWNLTGIPCFHACAVYGFLQLPVEEYVDHYYSKEMYLKAYENYIPPLPSEKYWPQVDLPLDPPPIKIGPGRPKKNRKKDPHEDPKKPGKLTRHGVKMSCSVCKSRTHNIRTCPNKGKVLIQPKKPRGRPRKIPKMLNEEGPSSNASTTVASEKPKRGRPRKVPKSTQSSQVTQV
ncbi:hypothetical protein SSX86_032465 [Deinandra increscens subsp. villosa]|uniref:SWIM-type domain-containing protein n=1 Tax=Deinandra increscens subsp. villosa TaxID=3103831 RepID=A0AAP0GHQ7_9ASTR